MMLILFVSKSRKGTILGFTARCYAAERGIDVINVKKNYNKR